MRIEDIIPVARGERMPDLLVRNARIVDVFSGEITKSNIAIYRKRIAGIGEYENGKKIIDLKGAYVVPGLIDAHLHIESSMVDPVEFARAVLTRGTTTVIADPHEIANVMGLKGIEYILHYTEGTPLNLYIMMPSSVPATSLETSGTHLRVVDMIGFLEKHPRVLGLGEVMNFTDVLNTQTEMITKIELFRHKYKKIDGHAPGLTGNDLNAYICAFIRSDHECCSSQEALEKMAKGMQVLIREGSVARNLDNLIEAVTLMNHHFFSFCTDDRHPQDILDEGHIDHMVRKAIKAGVNPIIAIRMATINTARHYNLRSMGAVAPGYKADMVITKSLEDFKPLMVIKDAQIVAKEGHLCVEVEGRKDGLPEMDNTFKCRSLNVEELKIRSKSDRKVNMIALGKEEITTKCIQKRVKSVNNEIVSDTKNDILKVAVISRYVERSMATGFVTNLGLKRGALATSVGHDSHNLCVVGTKDGDMVIAANRVIEMGGGMVIAADGKIVKELPLDIGGLMSSAPMEEVALKIKKLKDASHELGVKLEDPFMSLSFIQLGVIPEIRITDRGLVDVRKGEFMNLFIQ